MKVEKALESVNRVARRSNEPGLRRVSQVGGGEGGGAQTDSRLAVLGCMHAKRRDQSRLNINLTLSAALPLSGPQPGAQQHQARACVHGLNR